MKNTLIIALLCIGIGFGAAWLVKPATEETSSENGDSKKSSATVEPVRRPGQNDNLAKSGRPEPTGRVIVNGEDVEGDKTDLRSRILRGGGERFREMLSKRQAAKEEARILKLIDRLGLTDAQAAQLRAKLAKNRERVNALVSPENNDVRSIKDFARGVGDEHIDEALAEILTDEQMVAYEEMKERDRANKIESQAYRDLAEVQGILDLTPDQKDQVYEILHDQAGKNIDANKDANAIVATVATVTEGVGIDIDSSQLGAGISGAIQGVINQTAEGDEPAGSRADVLRAIQENRQRQIDQKVELLAPVLDDKQEDSYRNHLESQGGGVFGGLIPGGFNVESLSIPLPTPTPAPSGGDE